MFDPISLGLHAPTELAQLGKYTADHPVQDAATFVHELSHYLQFYGTAFGYNYLLAMRGCATCLQDGMKSLSGRRNISFPASEWPIDIGKVFADEESREFYTQAILMNRYYNEELRGFTYCHFGRNQPVTVDGHQILTSPLYLELENNTVFPFTGEALLENYAACQEIQFLSRCAPRDITERLVDSMYLKLPKELQALYMGIGVWIATFGLVDIEPLLYFTLLNQPQEGFLRRLGDYTLASHTKRLLTEFGRLQRLTRPKTSEEMRNVLQEIATIVGLADPLETLAHMRSLFNPSIDTGYWVVDWVSHQTWNWILDEPLRILTWPENLQDVLQSIPLLKLHFANRPADETINVLNVPQESLNHRHLAMIKEHYDYGERLYVITELYSRSRMRCPYWWQRNPGLCESCDACSGYLPDKSIQGDCPVMKKHSDLINIAS
jgi:hypothetical protein